MKLLERHFEIALETPDGVKKLRELILSFATQGKLVKQDPKDQPASKLLKEIEAEKRMLVKEGKVRNLAPLEPIKEVPYEIPTNWQWVRLIDIAEYNGRPNAAPEEIDQDTWVLDLEDIEKDTSRIINKKTYKDRQSKSTKSIFYEGDVLYGKLRPYLNKVVVADNAGVCTTEIVPIVPYKGVDSLFLKWVLMRPSFIEHVNALSYGVKMPRLGTTDAISSIHPLPPSNEQKRIVAKIDQLMVLCDKLEVKRTERDKKRLSIHTAAVNRLLTATDKSTFNTSWGFINKNFNALYSVPENVEDLKKAILQLAVMGKLVPQDPRDQPASELLKEIESEKKRLVKTENLKTDANPIIELNEEFLGRPIGWSYCRLGNLAKFIDYRGRTPRKVNSGIPLITAKNVRYGFINREPYEYITDAEYVSWMTRGFPKKNDLLFTTEAPLGNVAIIDIEEKFALAQRVICLQLHVTSIAPFLRLLIMSAPFQNQLIKNATGMTATGIKAAKLKEIPVPIPPLAEQKRIVAKIDQLMELCNNLGQQIKDSTEKQTAILDAVLARL
jgi:type I restriction enzyme S subunit